MHGHQPEITQGVLPSLLGISAVYSNGSSETVVVVVVVVVVDTFAAERCANSPSPCRFHSLATCGNVRR
jgi:hypothetical protein